MAKTVEQEIKEQELHEFMVHPVGFISGFLARRKAANEAAKEAKKKGLAGTKVTAAFERAATYNKLFNSAVEAFKGNPEEFKALLEAEGVIQ